MPSDVQEFRKEGAPLGPSPRRCSAEAVGLVEPDWHSRIPAFPVSAPWREARFRVCHAMGPLDGKIGQFWPFWPIWLKDEA